ncbi:MAG: gas vesicle protein GvpD basic region 2 domain-containing protein [Thermoplasmata archaeon]|jgi:GvpD gas vesicle protein
MCAAAKTPLKADGWEPIADPEGQYSTGISDFDRLLAGGFRCGSFALFSMDESVGPEDLDLLLFPTFLNTLYHSRGIIAVLPSRDSPHAFRARMTRYVTRRRFDSRVRIVDYVGEDEGPPYVVNLASQSSEPSRILTSEKGRKAAIAKMVEAERVVQGGRKKTFLEFTSFEVFETLLGVDRALKMFFYGIKRTRAVGNLGIGLLGPGLRCSAGVRRLVDAEFELHRGEVGLIIRGIRPPFSSYVVTGDLHAGPPHVAFVPQPS